MFKISFDNKTAEKINLFFFFHNPLVVAALPNTFARFDTPTFVSALMNLIGSTVFNFLNFSPNL